MRIVKLQASKAFTNENCLSLIIWYWYKVLSSKIQSVNSQKTCRCNKCCRKGFKIVYSISEVKCLFVCLGLYVPLENFSLIWRRHHCRWRAANFDLCSTLMAIEQWGFFSVSHLLWHGASVYNDYLQGPVTLTPVAERSALELSLSVFMTKVCRGWDSNTQPSTCGTNALTHCATAARFCVLCFVKDNS